MKKPIELKISGMHCRSCEILTKEELSLLNGVSDIEVSYQKQLAKMMLDYDKNSETDVIEAVKRAGYNASFVPDNQPEKIGNGITSPIVLKIPEKGVKITIDISPYSENGIKNH